MRRGLSLVLLVLVVGTAGCGSSWWQNFKSDPVARVQTFEQTVHTSMALADVAWNSLKPYLPADVAPKAQLRYEQAVVAVNKAILALNDAVQAAVDAQSPNPDFSKIVAEVSDAVMQVVAIVNEFKGVAPKAPESGPPMAKASSEPPKPGSPLGVDALNASVGTMKKAGGVK